MPRNFQKWPHDRRAAQDGLRLIFKIMIDKYNIVNSAFDGVLCIDPVIINAKVFKVLLIFCILQKVGLSNVGQHTNASYINMYRKLIGFSGINATVFASGFPTSILEYWSFYNPKLNVLWQFGI